MARQIIRAIILPSESHHATFHSQLSSSYQLGAGYAMTYLRMKSSALKESAASLQRRTPLKRTGFQRRSKELVTKKGSRIKSRGMKGRTPTALERSFMDAVAGLGCIACLKDGRVNPWISLHHIAGRTAVNAHMYVLPLCSNHHQHDDTDPAGRIGVHPHKARFEELYGTQMELLAECMAKIGWNANSIEEY